MPSIRHIKQLFEFRFINLLDLRTDRKGRYISFNTRVAWYAYLTGHRDAM